MYELNILLLYENDGFPLTVVDGRVFKQTEPVSSWRRDGGTGCRMIIIIKRSVQVPAMHELFFERTPFMFLP